MSPTLYSQFYPALCRQANQLCSKKPPTVSQIKQFSRVVDLASTCFAHENMPWNDHSIFFRELGRPFTALFEQIVPPSWQWGPFKKKGPFPAKAFSMSSYIEYPNMPEAVVDPLWYLNLKSTPLDSVVSQRFNCSDPVFLQETTLNLRKPDGECLQCFLQHVIDPQDKQVLAHCYQTVFGFNTSQNAQRGEHLWYGLDLNCPNLPKLRGYFKQSDWKHSPAIQTQQSERQTYTDSIEQLIAETQGQTNIRPPHGRTEKTYHYYLAPPKQSPESFFVTGVDALLPNFLIQGEGWPKGMDDLNALHSFQTIASLGITQCLPNQLNGITTHNKAGDALSRLAWGV